MLATDDIDVAMGIVMPLAWLPHPCSYLRDDMMVRADGGEIRRVEFGSPESRDSLALYFNDVVRTVGANNGFGALSAQGDIGNDHDFEEKPQNC